MEYISGIIFILIFIIMGIAFSRLSKLLGSEIFKLWGLIFEFFSKQFRD
jgi:TM2 domain-containing membrane protein YozV